MLSWPDFDIMSFGYSMNMYLCILGLAFFYSWAVFGTGSLISRMYIKGSNFNLISHESMKFTAQW